MVTANPGNGTVSVFIANATGGFNAAVPVGVGKQPVAVTTADVNGDGRSDIIAANSGGNTITVLTSTTGTSFSSATHAVGIAPTAVTTANPNADSFPDVIVADGGSGAISVLLNKGSGGFGAAATYAVGGGAGSDPLAVTTAALGGGLTFIGSTLGRGNATLQGVTYQGPLRLNQTDSAVTLRNSATLTLAGGTGAGFVQITGAGALLTVANIATLNSATIDIGSHVASDPAGFYAQGRGLTLGNTLTMVRVARAATLQSDRAIGDGIVNAGTMTAGIAGGTFVIQGGSFANLGSIAVSNGDTVQILTDREGNIANGLFGGGVWSVSGASTLQLPDDANVTLDTTGLTLTGSGSAVPMIDWFSSATQTDVTLQQSLATISASGLVNLNGAWTFASTVAGGLTLLGHLALGGATLSAQSLTIGSGGSLTGTGVVAGPVANSGTVTVGAGLLRFTGAVTGGGLIVISNGDTLDLAGSASSSVLVQFASASGRLILDAPTSDPVQVGGFVLGDTIDLRGFIETGATYTTLSAPIGVLKLTGTSGGSAATVTLTFADSHTLGNFKFASDGAGGTLLTDPPTVAVAVAGVALSADLTSLAASLVQAAVAPASWAVQSSASLGGMSGLADLPPTHQAAPRWPSGG